MKRSEHQHTWGAKGRDPRPGDYCLTCPQQYTPRIGGWRVDGYKPRTTPHAPQTAVVLEEAS